MKAFFSSKFEGVSNHHIRHNDSIIEIGTDLYREFIQIIRKISEMKNDKYVSIQEMQDSLGSSPYVVYSKRKIYERYSSGIIAGAGSSEDCVDLIDNDKWSLFDLHDDRMLQYAVGYTQSEATVNVVNYNSSGDTIVPVRDELIKDHKNIEVISIDSLELNSCELISADVEGAGLDVVSGAIRTMKELSPDLLISIYHNWTEYLHVIPFLHNNGYNIRVIYTASDTPFQPHIELSVFASKTSLYNIDEIDRQSGRQ